MIINRLENVVFSSCQPRKKSHKKSATFHNNGLRYFLEIYLGLRFSLDTSIENERDQLTKHQLNR